MKTFIPLVAVAVGLCALGHECVAQQMAYPMMPQAAYGPGGGYVYPGYVAPAAYAQPGGAIMAPGGAPGGVGAAAQPPVASCPPMSATDPGVSFENADCTCRIRNWQFYGELLWLRASNAEVPYAVPMNGPVDEGETPIEIGSVGVLNPDYSPAYRFGFARALDCAASIGVSYTRFESDVSSSIETDAPHVMRPLVIHPSTWDAASDTLTASGTYNINFQLIDVIYRCTFAAGDRWAADFILGARYGNLEQILGTEFNFNGTTTVNTEVTFDGGGPMVGLNLERHAACSGFLVYGRGLASLLAGEFNARYVQADTFPGNQVTTDWKGNRVVPVLEMEVGGGWASANGRLRVTGGYTVNAWFNTVKTADWISAVQTADFNHLSNTMAFDGFTARAEVRF